MENEIKFVTDLVVLSMGIGLLLLIWGAVIGGICMAWEVYKEWREE